MHSESSLTLLNTFLHWNVRFPVGGRYHAPGRGRSIFWREQRIAADNPMPYPFHLCCCTERQVRNHIELRVCNLWCWMPVGKGLLFPLLVFVRSLRGVNGMLIRS